MIAHVVAVLSSLLMLAAPARGNEPVDLELALAIDVSGSIDPTEARLQRQGYVQAFSDPAVIAAIRGGFRGRIAVLYYEWAGFGYNRIVVDWTVIHDEASARAFAANLAEASITSARRTSISGAIDFAVPLFAANAYDGTRKVIDISGDGPNNWGRLVTQARDDAVAAGITINGLPIVEGYPDFPGGPSMAGLDRYFQDCVIGGRSAFIIVAKGFQDFAAAVRRKLILEIAGRVPLADGRQVRRWGVAPRVAKPVQGRSGGADCSTYDLFGPFLQ